ncbi:MAG: hypothetical protein V7776_17025 [Halopseudomonas aestusnigri]
MPLRSTFNLFSMITNLAAVPLDIRDVPGGFLFAGYLKGRTLPVAAARFLEDVSIQLGLSFG